MFGLNVVNVLASLAPRYAKHCAQMVGDELLEIVNDGCVVLAPLTNAFCRAN